MPLLWVLREVLNLQGTQIRLYVCVGVCGACTVHMNGQAVRSCITLAAAATNARIVTLEGLSPDGSHLGTGGMARD